MKITNKITAGVLTVALAAFCVPTLAIGADNLNSDTTSGGNYVAPNDNTIHMTYGDSQTFIAVYTTKTDLGKNVQATWSGTGLKFDPTTLTVSCEKKTETSALNGTTTEYYAYTTTVKGIAASAGNTTLSATIGGKTAKINGENSVTISVAKKRVSLPAADKTTFVYQKDLKQYPVIAENDAYTVTIPNSVDKGNYVAIIALKDAANTEWASVDEKTGKDISGDTAAKTIAYSIVDRDYAAELDALQKKYSETENELGLTKTQLNKTQASLTSMADNYSAIKIKNTAGKTIKIKVYNPKTGSYTKTIKVKKNKTVKISKYVAIN